MKTRKLRIYRLTEGTTDFIGLDTCFEYASLWLGKDVEILWPGKDVEIQTEIKA